MKLHSRSFATRIITATLMATLFASCSSRYDALEYAYQVAGPNRGELEAVLEHYKGEPLKLAAARFLIENMPGHYSYKKNKEIEEYYDIALQLTRSSLSPKEQRDSLLYLSDNQFFGLDKEIIEDARIITSEYLIQNIDKAFDAWRSERWAQHVTFDEFCEWILPYKCTELQSFDCWRDTMRQTFWWNVAHMEYDDESYDSPFRAVNTIRSEITWRVKPVGMYNRAGYPMRSASTLAHMSFGSCADYVNLGVLTFRSYGIPVIIEETPSWGRYRAGHTWYTLLNDNGEEMRSEWDISSVPGSPFFPHQRIPKVYRHQYAINRERVPYHNRSVYKYPFNIFAHDVTDRYFNTTDVTIDVRKNIKLAEDFAYIATFNGHSSEWTLIDFGVVKRGKVTFNKMGRNILYIALGYDGTMLMPISLPFIIHKDGSIEYISIDQDKTRSVDVHRKYYSSENVVNMRKRLLGGRIQASAYPDFRDAVTLYRVDSLDISDKIKLPQGGMYRYWRYLSPDGSYGSIAELSFFSPDSAMLRGTPICQDGTNTDNARKAFDGNWLTNYETERSDGNWVGADMGQSQAVGFVRIVPRSDDNDIHPGDEYELKYWDGYFWITHDIRTATDNVLHYDGVPDGALMWLHDLTRGWDERPFRIKNGKVEWW